MRQPNRKTPTPRRSRSSPSGRPSRAEIRGLDLRLPLSAETFRAFETVLIEYKIIYMRDQPITTAQHVALGRRFGELEVHPFRPEGEFPEIMVLDNHKDNPVLSTDVVAFRHHLPRMPDRAIRSCAAWKSPGPAAIHFGLICAAAYDGLSAPLKNMIDGLDAVHDFKNFRALFTNSEQDRARLRQMEALYPNPIHPVVRTHPVTGRKALFVNRQFTLRIIGLKERESQALLELLYEQAQVPEYQFRLRWKPHTIVLWDNRSTQHYAANDYYPNRRHMERVAVMGDRPR